MPWDGKSAVPLIFAKNRRTLSAITNPALTQPYGHTYYNGSAHRLGRDTTWKPPVIGISPPPILCERPAFWRFVNVICHSLSHFFDFVNIYSLLFILYFLHIPFFFVILEQELFLLLFFHWFSRFYWLFFIFLHILLMSRQRGSPNLFYWKVKQGDYEMYHPNQSPSARRAGEDFLRRMAQADTPCPMQSFPAFQ